MDKKENSAEIITHELVHTGGIAVERYYSENITRLSPILFIHGAFHGSWLYHHFQDYFARHGFDTYALNWKGHYLSEPDPDLGKRSIIDAVEDAEKVVKQVIKKTPILVGHSMGVLISLKFAERNDAKLAVLLDGAPYRKIYLDAGLDKVLTKEGIEKNFNITEDYRFILPRKNAAQSFFDPELTGKDEMSRYLTLVQEESGKILIDVFTGKIEVNSEIIKIPLYVLGKAFSPTGHRLNEMKARDLRAKDCRVFEKMSHDMMLQKDWRDYADIILGWIENEKF
ncbi:MAG: alpha/beta fold hydrolase [Candidatus Schekmanbacteria bacterium]|nr:alpha/beta fold hydrolase [Candidatus Schekmanbacteria bacterium]